MQLNGFELNDNDQSVGFELVLDFIVITVNELVVYV